MNKFPFAYKNGDYYVKLFEDGSKLRVSHKESPLHTKQINLKNMYDINEEFYNPTNPEVIYLIHSIYDGFDTNDVDVLEKECTFKCCYWCYSNLCSLYRYYTSNKKINLFLEEVDQLNSRFRTVSLDNKKLGSISAGTEIELIYNDTDDFTNFLEKMDRIGVFCNISIDQFTLINNWHRIKYLQEEGLIYKIRVSIFKLDNSLSTLIKDFKRIFGYTVWGVYTPYLYKTSSKYNNKIYVDGYKNIRSDQKDNLIMDTPHEIARFHKWCQKYFFNTQSWEQSNMDQIIHRKKWSPNFICSSHKYSFYLDIVQNKFYNTIKMNETMHDIGNKSITQMFETFK